MIRTRRFETRLIDENFGLLVTPDPSGIFSMQSDEAFLDSRPVHAPHDLSASMDIPLQILMNAKCDKCGQ